MWYKSITIATVLSFMIGINPLTLSAEKNEKKSWKKEKGLYAIFETSMGTIVCRLFENETPKTVENFVGLAEGKKEWFDIKSQKRVKKKFYNGLIFHRVIPNFMIQGGCPAGNGRGGPGYRFEDEIVPQFKFDGPGILAMANSGPNTNGSQFFITEVSTPWLNGKHTIFGKVVEGFENISKIANVKKNSANKPLEDVMIKKLKIKRIGKVSKKAKNLKKEFKGQLAGKNVLLVTPPRNFQDAEYFDVKNILVNAGAKVITASLTKGNLIGMSGGKTMSDITLRSVRVDDYNAIIFIGGSGSNVFWNNPVAHQIAKESKNKDMLLGAICLAPLTLSKAGLLENVNVSCFPSIKNEIASNGAIISNKPVEQDKNIITGSGPEASKEFGFAILKALSHGF